MAKSGFGISPDRKIEHPGLIADTGTATLVEVGDAYNALLQALIDAGYVKD